MMSLRSLRCENYIDVFSKYFPSARSERERMKDYNVIEDSLVLNQADENTFKTNLNIFAQRCMEARAPETGE